MNLGRGGVIWPLGSSIVKVHSLPKPGCQQCCRWEISPQPYETNKQVFFRQTDKYCIDFSCPNTHIQFTCQCCVKQETLGPKRREAGVRLEILNHPVRFCG